MNYSLNSRPAVTVPFDSSRSAKEFSASAVLACLLSIFALIYANQAPHTSSNMVGAVVLDMLIVAPLLYVTQWYKAYMFEFGIIEVAVWYQRVLFGALGLVLLVQMFTVALS
jgi:hypothetical protein